MALYITGNQGGILSGVVVQPNPLCIRNESCGHRLAGEPSPISTYFQSQSVVVVSLIHLSNHGMYLSDHHQYLTWRCLFILLFVLFMHFAIHFQILEIHSLFEKVDSFVKYPFEGFALCCRNHLGR